MTAAGGRARGEIETSIRRVEQEIMESLEEVTE
jgi:hypothetical protein